MPTVYQQIQKMHSTNARNSLKSRPSMFLLFLIVFANRFSVSPIL